MKREYWNIGSALLMQIVTVFCGLLGPRVLMSTYGAEAYGATVSIAQFLSCITLLEGGMGAVARAELYEPLAKGDWQGIGRVYCSMRRFFRGLAIIFLVYTLALACGFHHIAAVSLWEYNISFCLVMAMGISTALQYAGGVSDIVLLNADRRHYVGQLSYALCMLLNTAALILLTEMGCSLLTVKVCTAVIFLLRPMMLHVYSKKYFPCLPMGEYQALPQSPYGLGQHIAYFFHRNTDIILLTLFADLKLTAIYGVYLLVCGNLRNLCISFSTGMEAELGKQLVETGKPEETFHRYESRMRKLSSWLFGTATLLILPFITLYTKGLHDIEYRQPLFAALLLLAEWQYCLMQPVYALPLAANRFKETRWAAYGEAILNIVLSCLLMQLWEPLSAVAAGTILAQTARGFWLRRYIGKEFFAMQSDWKALLPMLLLLLIPVAELPIENWIQWVLWGFALVTVLGIMLFGKDLKNLWERRWKQ